MIERRHPIPVPIAISRVMEAVRPADAEAVPVDRCYGRILARDACADADIPPFDRSAFDGYALSAADTVSASPNRPVDFEIVERIAAGQVATKRVGPFQAVRIMTGAPIPPDCNAIVMQEWTEEFEKDGKRFMRLKRAVQSGDNVSFRGEEAVRGTLLLHRGIPILPGTAAVLASLGHREAWVGRRPVVGVMATGSELAEPGETLEPGQIRNSNAAMLAAQIERAGGISRYYGRVPDDLQSHLDTYRMIIQECDVVVSTGGVSVGDYDFMPRVYRELGARMLFDKVQMRPGSVTTVAELDGKLLFGLSGNPSACYVGFELFARPAIRKMQQAEAPFPLKTEAVLLADFPKPNPFSRFVRAKTVFRNGRIGAVPVGLDKSSSVTSLSESNALIVMPGGTRGYREGNWVELLLLDEREGAVRLWEDDIVRLEKPEM